MELSVDFGASTIDVIQWKKGRIFAMESFERELLQDDDLECFLKKKAGIQPEKIERLFLTGGKSRKMKPTFCNYKIVDEIEAIGRGGFYLWHNENSPGSFEKKAKLKSSNVHKYFGKKILVVSMGTGTCMVNVMIDTSGKLHIVHAGGTGIGGGTFLALCKEILGETRISCLRELFQKGDTGNVDLSVKEIVGSGIGRVPASATASNLAKMAKEISFARQDKAAGIANMIGQTIGILAVFAAMASQAEFIILTGKLTKIGRIMDTIFAVSNVYSMPMQIPQHAEYVSAIGAGLSEC